MRRFVVVIEYPFPLIGTARIEVEANTHAHATLVVRGMRVRMGWPRGSAYTPRLLDTLSYVRPATLAPLEHAEALSTW